MQQAECRRLVTLHRDLTDEHPPSLLLEWLEGVPLSERLVRGQPLPAHTAFWIARQTVEGMRSLAAVGFAHGDLRLRHVLVDDQMAVRLIGLGSATPLDRAATRVARIPAIETAEYLAPERQTSANLDPVAADIYSLGVMLFELLAGRPPYLGGTSADVLRLHRQAKPPRLAGDDLSIPTAGMAFVDALLRKEPLRRPRDLTAILRQLLDLELQSLA